MVIRHMGIIVFIAKGSLRTVAALKEIIYGAPLMTWMGKKIMCNALL